MAVPPRVDPCRLYPLPSRRLPPVRRVTHFLSCHFTFRVHPTTVLSLNGPRFARAVSLSVTTCNLCVFLQAMLHQIDLSANAVVWSDG